MNTDVREALFPEPVNGISDDAYYNLLGVLQDIERGEWHQADLDAIRRVLTQLERARSLLSASAEAPGREATNTERQLGKCLGCGQKLSLLHPLARS